MSMRAQTLRGWDGDRTAVPPVPDVPRKPAGKKDTKRWCAGKVGREHAKRWVPMWAACPREASDQSYVETCEACGKKFRHCWRMFIGYKDRACICGNHGGR